MRCLPLLVALPMMACSQEEARVQYSSSRDYCDGTFVTSIVQKEHILTSRSPLSHGSVCKEHSRWTGAIQWKLPEGSSTTSLDPVRIVALDRQDAKAKDQSGARLPPVGFQPFLTKDKVAAIDIGIGELSQRRLDDLGGPPAARLKIDAAGVLGGNVDFTRTGKYLLAHSGGKTFIASTSDLRTVREIATTPGFVAFNASFKGIEDHLRVLTEDLRYLIKVPHNAGNGQGHNHCKAVVYDLEKDATDEVTLRLGTGDTAIADVESVNGELVFLAYEGSSKPAVLTGRSEVVAWLPGKTRFFNFKSNTFWDPGRKRFVVWDRPELLSWGPIVVTDHNYGTNTTLTYQFQLGDAMRRIGDR